MTYPHEPGWRSGPNSATSREGAVLAGVKAPALKLQILEHLARRPSTPEEITAAFEAEGNRQLLNTIRARCTDLYKAGQLMPSGTFGLGESRKVRVIRWRLSTSEELALHLARRAADAEHGEGSQ